MTDKQFVRIIHPDAYFYRGEILTKTGMILWQDEYGLWAKDWKDYKAINNAWHELAEIIKNKFLKKLES